MMKKKHLITAIFLAAAMMLLSACAVSGAEKTPPVLPGTQWGGSIDQVLESQGTSREELGENLMADEEETGSATAILENKEVFGQKSEGLILFFAATKDGHGAFTRAEIYYPDSTDMEAVRKSMEKAFGPPAQTVTLYDQRGKAQTLASDKESQYWQGQLLQEALNGDQQIALRQYVAGQGPEIWESISDSQWKDYLKNPLSTARWYTNYQNALTEQLKEEPNAKVYRNVVVLEGSLQAEVESLS